MPAVMRMLSVVENVAHNAPGRSVALSGDICLRTSGPVPGRSRGRSASSGEFASSLLFVAHSAVIAYSVSCRGVATGSGTGRRTTGVALSSGLSAGIRIAQSVTLGCEASLGQAISKTQSIRSTVYERDHDTRIVTGVIRVRLPIPRIWVAGGVGSLQTNPIHHATRRSYRGSI